MVVEHAQITKHVTPYKVNMNGKEAFVNAKLADDPKYAFLFQPLTLEECNRVLLETPFCFALQWASILLCWQGWISTLLMCFFNILAFARHGYAVHDASHLEHPMPFLYRMCMPFEGFTLIKCCQGDLAYSHLMKHHHFTKSVIHVHEKDWDGKWSSQHLLVTISQLLLWPGQFAMPEVFHQWMTGPSSLWPERIALQIVYYAQIFVVYQMGLLMPVLIASHLASCLLYLLFHGLTHRESFYYYLLRDPTGLRRLPYIDTVVHTLIPARGWTDMKFHDLHHTFSNSLGSLCVRILSNKEKTRQEIEEIIADMIDEGIYVDKNGTPVPHLAESGQRLGSRKEYLQQMQSKEKVKHS